MDLTQLTLTKASRLIQKSELSPIELTRAFLQRIEALNPLINAFITVTPELALGQAEQAEKQLFHGLIRTGFSPLHGIPLALKDLFETRGVLTTAGSKFFREYIPEDDAATVKKLSTGGAALLGKLNMHEIALGVTNVNPHFGACRNPWDIERISGGSSGGAAAALAVGMCLGALGTDTGGSIRIPAALCGVVGLKPTRGRVSLRGVIPLSWNLDHAGPMARQVRDAAVLLQMIAGFDPDDPYSIDIPVENYSAHLQVGVHGLRIALANDDYFIERSDPEVWQAVEQAAEVFGKLGAQVSHSAFPGAYQAALANSLMTTSEAAVFHRDRLQTRPEDFGEDVLQRLKSGASYSIHEYIQARHTQAELRHQFVRFFDQYDILLTPTTPVTAPRISGSDAIEQARLLTRFTAPFNLTGLPALSLPCGFSSQGLPIGLQVIARPWAEALALRAAYAYEQASAWHTRTLELR